MKRFLLLLFLTGGSASQAWAQWETGGDFVLMKDLWGGSGGPGLTSASYSMNLSMGEPAAGFSLSNSTSAVMSGYYAGFFGGGGALSILSYTVGGSPTFFQNGLQIGVTSQAPIQINFSDQLDPSTLAAGITVSVVIDHLAQPSNSLAPITFNYNPTGASLTITPQGNWQGNTLYDVVLNQNLLSLDEFGLTSSTGIPFLTALDPQQENVALNPLSVPGLALPASGPNGLPNPSFTLDIPQSALSDYSFLRFSQDPLNSPLGVDPSLIRNATAKAQAARGIYETPVTLEEIAAYNLQGQAVSSLSFPVQATLSYSDSNGLIQGGNGVIRSGTLSFWALDQVHDLWVKMPASSVNPAAKTVTAPITQFSVYALMGEASGSASEVFVFPTPWRPHGPDAGTGPGQTGTDAGGMTFNNLPSECSIKIYTLSGRLVRELNHSDTGGSIGQEKWDGLTSSGAAAASGVYLWRVISSTDGKNGKLMIIR